MPRFQTPRGTRDLLPAERATFLRLERLATDLSTRYGYAPMDTPLFEDAAVFERGVGAVTDVVEKELFRVQAGRGEDAEGRWALRPEPTAGIVRAYIQHGMQTLPQPVRVSLTGPFFRYDRPQLGRYRQFWQFDVEAIGDPGPAVDAEIIQMAGRFYTQAGLGGVELRLNSIGDPVCRPSYLERLTKFYREREDQLPAAERERLERNPLRLLDSKDPRLAALNAHAPRITDDLCEDCRQHFAAVQAHLDALGISYMLEPKLVRGLDYYTRTTFEFFPSGQIGQQDAIGGGGRYDGLVELLGGRPTPAIGFGIGLDRVMQALAKANQGQPDAGAAMTRPVAVIVGADPSDTITRLRVVTDLRAAGIAARADLSTRNLKRQLESAARDGAHFAVICGQELEQGQVQLRDLEAGTQRVAAAADLARELQRAESQHRHGQRASTEAASRTAPRAAP